MSKELAASGQLSAETIKAVRKHWDNCSDVVALCDMALSSLRGTFADGRICGIEEATTVCHPDINGWNNSSDRHIAFTCMEKISALAQGQRTSEQDADELLREVLDWGLPDDLKQRIDAHLARKEPK